MTTTLMLTPAHSDASIVRAHAYAARSDGAAVDIKIERERGRHVVRWNARTVRGWHKGYKHTAQNEEAAASFAAEKLNVLLAWLDRCPTGAPSLPGDWTCAPSY